MNDTVICMFFFNIYMYALIWGYATELCQIDISFNSTSRQSLQNSCFSLISNVLAIGCRIIKSQPNVKWSGGANDQQS